MLMVLAGCGGAPPAVDPLELPGAVVARLPLDIDLSEVNRDPDGCYFYTYAAHLFVVRDAAGHPVCLP